MAIDVRYVSTGNTAMSQIIASEAIARTELKDLSEADLKLDHT